MNKRAAPTKKLSGRAIASLATRLEVISARLDSGIRALRAEWLDLSHEDLNGKRGDALTERIEILESAAADALSAAESLRGT